MGQWELGDFTMAKPKMCGFMDHQLTVAIVSLVQCMYHSSAQALFYSTAFYQQLSQRSRVHFYQNTICKKTKRVNLIS